VSPAGDFYSGGFLGGPFTPVSQDYLLQNLNATPLSYQVTVTQPWLSVANGSGTIPGDGSSTVTVSINSEANNLPADNYSDIVSFVNTTDHDGDTTRAVSLAVYWPLPTITTTSLPDGYINDAYGPVQFQASGGKSPLSWSLPPQGAYAEVDLGSSGFAEVGTAQGWQADNQVWLYPLPFSFPFYGTHYGSVWVCSNGFLHFGMSSSASPDNSDAILRAATRIAPMWDDLRTTGTGQDIFIDSGTSGEVTVRWAAETVAVPNDPCNFSVTLYSDGKIRFHYGVGNTNLTPTIGISRGNGSQYTLSTYNNASALTAVNSQEFVPPTSLPPGLSFFADGILSGMPTQAGTFYPTFKVTDALGRSDQRMIPLVVEDHSQPPIFDCDGNGQFTLEADTACFVDALLSVPPPVGWDALDLNDDTQVDGLDIQKYIELIVGS
ncbi:MAG: putative Ig domain-containing protein, partial [Planctomycetota bacterium]